MLMLKNILCYDRSFCEKMSRMLCWLYSLLLKIVDKIRNALIIYENEMKKSPQETAGLKDCIEDIRYCIHFNRYNEYFW